MNQPDKVAVSCFARHAEEILNAAEVAQARGLGSDDSGMTIVVRAGGGIEMLCAGSARADWPLESLARESNGVAYRVTRSNGTTWVEARDGMRTMHIHSMSHRERARQLLLR